MKIVTLIYKNFKPSTFDSGGITDKNLRRTTLTVFFAGRDFEIHVQSLMDTYVG